MKFHKKHIITFACLGLAIPAILASKSLLPGGEIYLTHEDNNNFHVVEVNAKDLAHQFFGTAFHLNYDTKKYTYDHFTLGDYFEVQDNPMVLVNPQSATSLPEAKIIVGISLKRGQLLTKPEGILLKLYFKDILNNSSEEQNLLNEFFFSNAVFSSFDMQKNERKDIKNIIFYP